ncbi:MAG TPA: hypothetical protein VK722_02055 [Candidatus Aquilonibacter sp.]|jgi:hypothetical protein|nr:hypothetical protein [Candidatus Aquilonibacter sp.]
MLQLSLSRFHLQLILISVISQSTTAFSTNKPHIITFGKSISVQWFAERDAENAKAIPLKVRPLLVDARMKEFTLGLPHDVTDRLFVIRRAFRMNDSLPEESASPPHWQWQRGGWLLVDRVTARISPLNLPEFDTQYSAVSWYRDYAAYCGLSDDGKKIYAVVAQINRRKPVLKKVLDSAAMKDEEKIPSPDSICPAPAWQRSPARVSFEPTNAAKQTFAVRGHLVDLITEEEDDEEAEK